MRHYIVVGLDNGFGLETSLETTVCWSRPRSRLPVGLVSDQWVLKFSGLKNRDP